MTSALQMLTGGGMLFGLGSVLGEWPRLLTNEVSATSVLAFGYLVLAGVAGFATYTWLLSHASPPAVSTYAYVNPLIAVLLGWLALDERVDWPVLVAAALVVGAVLLITLPARRAAVREVRREPERLRWLPWRRRQVESCRGRS
jgi:drug/metabolite transporter (DMT)-like permease